MKPTPSVDSLTRGAVIAERTVGPFRFVQSAYGPGAYLSAHSHDISKISLILAGGTEERHRNSDDRFGPGSVVIKPKYATHANSFSPGGMQGFAVSVDYHGSEVDSAWSAATQQYRWINVREITRAMFELSRLVFCRRACGTDSSSRSLRNYRRVHLKSANSHHCGTRVASENSQIIAR